MTNIAAYTALTTPSSSTSSSSRLPSSRSSSNSSSAASSSSPSPGHSIPLGEARRGFCGRIYAIQVDEAVHGRQANEIESRLIELGFVEGAEIKVLHEGPIGRDPIAVRINGTTIALRRREAMAILMAAS
jgi:ferrous iron transport protein A